MNNTLLNKFIIAVMALYASACSHYQLGSPSKLPFTSIYVAPADNDSFAPQVQAMLTQQVADALLMEGIRLTSKNVAEATLEITITHYNQAISAKQGDDTALAESFALEVKANATLINNKTGESYFVDRPHSTQQQAYVDGGFQSSTYQAMPVLLERLAANIKDTVISVW